MSMARPPPAVGRAGTRPPDYAASCATTNWHRRGFATEAFRRASETQTAAPGVRAPGFSALLTLQWKTVADWSPTGIGKRSTWLVDLAGFLNCLVRRTA